MEQGAVFKSNRSQAIRIPKAVALPDDVTKVDVIAIGRTRIITPAGESWTSWFDSADADVTADFMAEREQPEMQEREDF
jgi:antitoxin VapB